MGLSDSMGCFLFQDLMPPRRRAGGTNEQFARHGGKGLFGGSCVIL